MKKINIDLPNGSSLEVEYVDGFIEKVREGLCLLDSDNITDSHIRRFIFESFKIAVDKAESSGYLEEEVDQTSFR
tara:strand:- start:535 stop:759 length:225 start_codon:yes stop_codon:yes gene_type:complete